MRAPAVPPELIARRILEPTRYMSPALSEITDAAPGGLGGGKLGGGLGLGCGGLGGSGGGGLGEGGGTGGLGGGLGE
jgi:hypothetical protein